MRRSAVLVAALLMVRPSTRFADATGLCIFVCMRTTVDLDRELLESALKETGARTKTEVLEMGLRALLEREARKRLKALYGREPQIEEVKRRRP